MYHDRLFKQLMRSDFPGFVQLFFPSVFAQTDFSTLEWLDKEFFADLPSGAVTAQLHYQVVGLPKLSAEDYLKQGTLMAGALGASMSPGQWSRAELKLYCLETVARAPAFESWAWSEVANTSPRVGGG